MSEREEHDFLKDYLTWMKGPGLDQESLHLYNFGYERPLPFPSIAPDSTLSFNLKTAGLQTPSRWSLVVIGGKYLGRLQDIMSTLDRIHENTQVLPFVTWLATSGVRQTFCPSKETEQQGNAATTETGFPAFLLIRKATL